jgi:hypothetical protein
MAECRGRARLETRQVDAEIPEARGIAERALLAPGDNFPEGLG